MNRPSALRVMGLNDPFTEEAFKTASRKRAKETHPDSGGSEQEFKEYRRAHDILYGTWGYNGEHDKISLEIAFETVFGSYPKGSFSVSFTSRGTNCRYCMGAGLIVCTCTNGCDKCKGTHIIACPKCGG